MSVQPRDFEPTPEEVDRNNRASAALQERQRVGHLLASTGATDVQYNGLNTLSYSHAGDRFTITVECTEAWHHDRPSPGQQ